MPEAAQVLFDRPMEQRMASVSTYLNFPGNCEEAFDFYKAAFRSEIAGEIMRYGEAPPMPGATELSDDVKRKVMNMELPITGGYVLRGADAIPEFGFTVRPGNTTYICLDPESREESDRLFAALSEGGKVEMAPAEQFWGDYFGSWEDKYGIQWMINCTAKG
jgi:PhnB protein